METEQQEGGLVIHKQHSELELDSKARAYSDTDEVHVVQRMHAGAAGAEHKSVERCRCIHI